MISRAREHAAVEVSIVTRLREGQTTMSRSEQKIAEYLLRHPAEAMYLSITEVADRASVGEATVSRFCRRLGLAGFQDLKLALAQEAVPPTAAPTGPPGEGAMVTLTRQVARRGIGIIEETSLRVDQDELTRAITLLAGARKIDFYGVGSSGLTALDAQQMFLSIGKLCSAYVDPHVQAISASLLTTNDVALAFSHSGSTKDVVASLSQARQHGATTVCVTSSPRSPITHVADVVLLAATAETTVARSLRAKTAHLFLVEVLLEGCIERLGDAARRASDTTMAAVIDKMY